MTNKDILKIIASTEVTDQQELLDIIQKHGHTMTQSTLSRRLKKMGVKKKHGVYIIPSAVETTTPDIIKRIDEAPPNMLVVLTAVGFAPALAYQLDFMCKNTSRIDAPDATGDTGFDEILGTISGQDTVFIAVRPGMLEECKAKILNKWSDAKK